MSNILVVDDDPEVLNMVDVLLTPFGYNIQTEHRSENVFHKIKSFHPDVVLLDINLGDEDGRDISKKIKSDTNTKDIAVILFSGVTGISKNLQEALNNDFISKPFDAKNLVNKIQNQVQNISLAKNIITDKKLMALMGNHANEALGLVYDKYASILYGYILSIIKNEKRSEDILIEVFLEMYKNCANYNSHEQSLLIWSIKIANKFIIENDEAGAKLIETQILNRRIEAITKKLVQ